MANAPSSLTHDFLYFYEDPQGPNRPSQIGSKLLEFDANGNPTVIHDTATGDFRRMIWDEENRLMFLSDNGNMHHFVYDHRGERVIKSNSGLQNVFMDGLPVGTLENNRRTVIYVSPYFVMRDGGFTKHYFAGTQRVLSKLGTGRFHNRFTPSNRVITAGNKNYIQRQQQLRQGLYDPMRELQIPPGNPTQRPNITRPDYTGQPRPTIVGNYEIPRGWPRQPITAPPGGPPGPPIQWGPEITNDNVRAGYTYLPNSLKETAQFFFHPDHLGSTTLITDRHGNITQFIAYLPFGELLVNEHTTSRTTPFLFTGKELDSETGLYYFGYRYFDPRLAIWLGVDPLWELHPHIGGFVYTANNPTRFVDPDGRNWVVPEGTFNFQWMDDVTSQRNTPRGYQFVGGDNASILSHMNLQTNFEIISENRMGASLQGAEGKRGIIPLTTRTTVIGQLSVSVDVSFSPNNRTENNLLGREFMGISFHATLTQEAIAATSGLLLDFAGHFYVQHGRANISSPLAAPSAPHFRQEGTSLRTSQISIPASNLSPSRPFGIANIRAGAPMQETMFHHSAIDMRWNLRTPRQFFQQR